MDILALAVALAGLLPMLAQGLWTMPCYGTVVRERIDPVINPGFVSDHVHRVVGGSGINFTMDGHVARSAGCSSCSVKQDKSNYWVPQLYASLPGPVHIVVPDGRVNITYAQIGNGLEDVNPFPEGLTVAVGNPARRNFTGDAVANAITFRCDGESDSFHELPQHCATLIATVKFPSCWDGHHVASADFISHMSYDVEGTCPSTHPVRVISLRYDFEFHIADSVSGQLTFSMGDPTGYGFHGVFINGWEPDALQTAVETCLNNDTGDIATTCSVLRQYDAEQCMDCRVPPRVHEPIDQISALPGCNETSVNCTHQSPSDYQLTYQDLTHAGWQYEGCASSGIPFGSSPDDRDHCHSQRLPDLRPDLCATWCKEHVATTKWFGLHDGQCFCSMVDPKPESLPAVGYFGSCDDECAGNRSFTCGGTNRTSLYKYCGASESCRNAEFKQWPDSPGLIPKRSISDSNGDSTKKTPWSNTEYVFGNQLAVSGARIEGPCDDSIFVGYKVCKRSLDLPDGSSRKGSSSVSLPSDGIVCTVVEGDRAESVAASFFDWAIAKYELDPLAVFASPEDVLDARMAKLRRIEAAAGLLLICNMYLLSTILIYKTLDTRSRDRVVIAATGATETASHLVDVGPTGDAKHG